MDFSGEYKNKNEVIIYAIEHLRGHITPDYVGKIFNRITDRGQWSHIESILMTSNLFEYTLATAWHTFKLKPEVLMRVNEIGVEKFLLENENKVLDETHIKKLIKDELKLSIEKLQEEIASKPKVEKRESSNATMNIILAVVSLISLAVSIRSCQLAKSLQKPSSEVTHTRK